MKTKLTWFDRMMAAVTFAEADEPDAAEEFFNTPGRKSEMWKKCEECDAVLATDLQGVEAHS